MAIFNGRDWTLADFLPFNYVKVWDQFWNDVLVELGLRKQAIDAAVTQAQTAASTAGQHAVSAASAANTAALIVADANAANDLFVGLRDAAQEAADDAEAEANRAQGYAAGLHMPVITAPDAGKPLVVAPDGTGFALAAPFAGGLWGGAAGGSANALTATTGSSLTSLTKGMIVGVKVGVTANNGAATLAVDSVAATAIRKDGAALAGGELAANTDRYFQFDGTYLRLLGGGVDAASIFATIKPMVVAGPGGGGVPSGCRGDRRRATAWCA